MYQLVNKIFIWQRLEHILGLYKGAKSSVVMKYFVSDKFRLYKNLKATKGAACRELHVWYFDFSVHKRATRARHAVYYICKISTFPFAVGLRGPGMSWVRFVIFRLFRSQTGEVVLWYFDFSYVKDNYFR
jgi:hypothetical protein